MLIKPTGRKLLSREWRLSSHCQRNQSSPQRVDLPAFTVLIQNESNAQLQSCLQVAESIQSGGRGYLLSLAPSEAEGPLTTRHFWNFAAARRNGRLADSQT